MVVRLPLSPRRDGAREEPAPEPVDARHRRHGAGSATSHSDTQHVASRRIWTRSTRVNSSAPNRAFSSATSMAASFPTPRITACSPAVTASTSTPGRLPDPATDAGVEHRGGRDLRGAVRVAGVDHRAEPLRVPEPAPTRAQVLLVRDADHDDLRGRERVGEVAMEVAGEPGAEEMPVGGAHVRIVHRHTCAAGDELSRQGERRRVAGVVGVGAVGDAEQGDRTPIHRAGESLDEGQDLPRRLVVDPPRLEDEAVRRIRASFQRPPPEEHAILRAGCDPRRRSSARAGRRRRADRAAFAASRALTCRAGRRSRCRCASQ